MKLLNHCNKVIKVPVCERNICSTVKFKVICSYRALSLQRKLSSSNWPFMSSA